MANDTSANPWKLDTVATVYNFPVKIDNIVWANFTTVADTLLITDINSKPIVDAIVASTSQGMMSFGKIGWVRGLIISSLTHGYVTIAVGAGK